MRISDWSSDVCSSDLKNIIVSSSERFDTYEYNGVTYEDVNVTQPVNSQKGYVYGLELSYTNPNFGLPGILNGLGMYGNFTYLKGGYKLDMSTAAQTYGDPAIRDTPGQPNQPSYMTNLALT